MSLSAGVFFAIIPGCWNVRTGYRTLNTANGMNMTPNQTGYFDALNFGWNAISAKWVTPYLLNKYDTKGAFERWSYVAIACHVLVSQAWRPSGSSQIWKVAMYTIPAMLVRCDPPQFTRWLLYLAPLVLTFTLVHSIFPSLLAATRGARSARGRCGQ